MQLITRVLELERETMEYNALDFCFFVFCIQAIVYLKDHAREQQLEHPYM